MCKGPSATVDYVITNWRYKLRNTKSTLHSLFMLGVPSSGHLVTNPSPSLGPIIGRLLAFHHPRQYAGIEETSD